MSKPALFLATFLTLATACSGQEKPASDASTSTGDQATHQEDMKEAPPAAGTELPAPARAAVDRALTAYEQVRAALAADSVEGIAAATGTIASSAREAKASAPENLHAQLESMATQAEKLGGMTDIETARTQFGELSRAVVGLVSTAPALGEGRFVYACPMASGYQKWVQNKEELQNPYMGTKMLACGSKSDWAE